MHTCLSLAVMFTQLLLARPGAGIGRGGSAAASQQQQRSGAGPLGTVPGGGAGAGQKHRFKAQDEQEAAAAAARRAAASLSHAELVARAQEDAGPLSIGGEWSRQPRAVGAGRWQQLLLQAAAAFTDSTVVAKAVMALYARHAGEKRVVGRVPWRCLRLRVALLALPAISCAVGSGALAVQAGCPPPSPCKLQAQAPLQNP